jgi:hypothetical protein
MEELSTAVRRRRDRGYIPASVVNSIWTNMVGVPIASERYDGNTPKMQAMLVLSNN